MIDHELSKAVYLAHNAGMSKRALSKQFNISRGTVRKIIANGGKPVSETRRNRIVIEPNLLELLYRECRGYKQRIHERLESEYNLDIPYSTLTERIRRLDIGQTKSNRSYQVEDEPGKEMQHDTSPYNIDLDGKRTSLIASLIYLRYSKKRYLKFYPVFNRFTMKCFFHEALTHWGYSAETCIIDNTHLAVHSGSGQNARFSAEMLNFSKQYGFKFLAHEIKHSDRKAGNERCFWTIETNFFPGRVFKSLEDLNQQAFYWATTIMATRPLTKKRIIAKEAFEQEKSSLIKLPPYLPRPYRVQDRLIDQYGYISFDGNHYWVPKEALTRQIRALEYSDELALYSNQIKLTEYKLPAYGIKNERIYPDSLSSPPHRPPRSQSKPSTKEQEELRKIDTVISKYVDFILTVKGIRQHHFIRGLYHHYKKLPREIFIDTIARALHYRVSDLESIERISIYYLNLTAHKLPSPEIDMDYQKRGSYQDGEYSESVDLDKFTSKENDDDK